MCDEAVSVLPVRIAGSSAKTERWAAICFIPATETSVRGARAPANYLLMKKAQFGLSLFPWALPHHRGDDMIPDWPEIKEALHGD